MFALVKYKNPTEYSFYQWIFAFPESGHPNDRIRFLRFTKTICSFNATKWKNVNYLEQRILKEKPNFNKDRLEEILTAYDYLIDAFEVKAMSRCRVIEKEIDVKSGYYIERWVKNGKFYEKELPISKQDL